MSSTVGGLDVLVAEDVGGVKGLMTRGAIEESVSVLRLVMLAWSGTRQSLALGHLHLLRTAASDTLIFAVRPSKMLTSLPSQMETYPASANFPPLRRDWLASAGIMLTVWAGSRTLCSSLAMVVAGVGWPLASANILVNFCPVEMKGSPIMPPWEVQAASHAADGMEPLSIPILVCALVSLVSGGRASGWRRG